MIVATYVDITELKKAQQMIQQANAELEQRVDERTFELKKANEEMQHEIHERRRVENALQESEGLLTNIINFLPDATLAINARGQVTAWNRAMEEMTGVKAEEMLGKGNFEYAMPFYGIRRPILIDLALKSDKEIEKDYLFIQKGETILIAETDLPSVKGENSFLWGKASPIHDSAGNITGAIESIRDITQRKQAQFSLLESEKKYGTLVENSLTGIYINLDGKIVFANKQFSQIFGYSVEELTDIESWKLVHPDDRDLIAGLREKRLKGEKYPMKYEARGLKKDGTVIWVERINSRIEYQGKQAILGNILDITQRKQMEAAWQKSQKDLQLLSSRLLRAQEEERKRIARDLHDTIAQNLAAIKVLLSDQFNQMKQGESSSGVRMEKILSAVESSIQDLRRIMTDLRPSILDELGVIAAIRCHCGRFHEIHPHIRVEKKIEIKESTIPDSLKTVIFRILQEAMNNIAKHSRADRVRLFLGEKDGKIAMVIEDNGRGFDVNKAFAPKGSGKGLGILGMKERTELSNGSFMIESRKGSGTIIRLSWQDEC
jgi:PAS domain S-box-containing protein